MADANCHKILMKALDFDEAGDKVKMIFSAFWENMNHQLSQNILGESYSVLHGSC
jgi:hypothetical protein